MRVPHSPNVTPLLSYARAQPLLEKALNRGVDFKLILTENITPPNDFLTIKEAFEKENLKFEMAELTMKADNEVELSGDEGIKMQKILDVLDDLDDVQEVYTNAVIEN